MPKKSNSTIFYGHIIVIASSFILLVMHGVGSTFSIFFSSLQTEFNANRTTISGVISVAFFLQGLYAIVLGRLADRYGPRVVITVCGIIFGIGYILMSQVDELWQLYLFYPVIVGIGISSGNVALLSTVTKWFVKNRGLMTSIVKVGTGAGILIVPLVASLLISNYGWRQAYLILGLFGLVWIVIIAQILKRDPERVGLRPYGMYDANGTVSDLTLGNQLSFQDTIRTRQFWAVSAIYFATLYVTQSVMIHTVSFALDNGIAITQAAGIVAIIGATSIAGRLVTGITGDRLGNRIALIICFSVLIVALSWLQFAGELWKLYLFAAIYGFAHGGLFTVESPLIAELFGTASHGANYGMVIFLGQIGGAVGPVVTGRIFDTTESYQLAFLILIVVSIGALALSINQLKPVQNLRG